MRPRSSKNYLLVRTYKSIKCFHLCKENDDVTCSDYEHCNKD